MYISIDNLYDEIYQWYACLRRAASVPPSSAECLQRSRDTSQGVTRCCHSDHVTRNVHVEILHYLCPLLYAWYLTAATIVMATLRQWHGILPRGIGLPITTSGLPITTSDVADYCIMFFLVPYKNVLCRFIIY